MMMYPKIRLVSALLSCILLGHTVVAEELEYRWQQGQKFSFDVEINVDAGNEAIAYKGVIHYHVVGVNGQQFNVNYRGGLTESKKIKRRDNSRFGRGGFGPGGFGPGGFGPPNFPSPFAKPVFRGKTQTTNRLVVSPTGGILAMEGDSQLPYLIGNVSVLPFEPLPGDDLRQWTSDGGVSITEENSDGRGPFGRLGSLGPFGVQSPKSVQAASEVSKYAIEKTRANLVVIRKEYRLNSPQTDDSEGFEMVGNGTWTFDTTDHAPFACDMKIDLKVASDNTRTTIPITIRYTRISAEKLAQMEEASKQRADELKRVEAEKKALAETPLSEEETRSTIAILSSNDSAKTVATLGKLAGKSLADPDPRVACAIAKHLDSSNQVVAKAASKAMAKWSPDFALQQRLKKEYEGPGAIKSTELYVESTTPLYVGQILQAQQPRRGSFWRAAKVRRLLPDGQVELVFLAWGKERDIAVVSRRNIQLAPPELNQTGRQRSADSASTRAGTRSPRDRGLAAMPRQDDLPGVEQSPVVDDAVSSRTWSDASGRFRVEATFVALEGDTVRLRRVDGRTLSIPISKLCKADQDWVSDLEQAENPFKLD